MVINREIGSMEDENFTILPTDTCFLGESIIWKIFAQLRRDRPVARLILSWRLNLATALRAYFESIRGSINFDFTGN